jgi:hypothetical protein
MAQDGDLSVWAVPNSLTSLSLAAKDTPWHVLGATLINEASGTFMSLTLGNYRLIHSGDVKIYENLDVLPRAFFVQNWQAVPDMEAALAVMADPAFDGGKTAVLLGAHPSDHQTGEPGEATIQLYAPERIVIHTANADAGLLLLTDANYAGWQAWLDGEPVPIETADILFRGVFVPGGEHEIVFKFKSKSYENGRYLTCIGLLLLLVFLIIAAVKANKKTLL